jgi:hypothetical protein
MQGPGKTPTDREVFGLGLLSKPPVLKRLSLKTDTALRRRYGGVMGSILEYKGGGNPGHRPADASRTNRFIRSSGSSVPSGGECLLSCRPGLGSVLLGNRSGLFFGSC